MKYNKTHAAVCGLFCPACTVFIATQEDPKRLEVLAKQFGTTTEEMKCFGCRSEKRIPYCDTCKIYPCAQKKGVDFCGECDEYPCEEIKTFQAAGAHRFELWEDQVDLKNESVEKWIEKKIKYYSCSDCGTINSAYDFKCRSCGSKSSNQYVTKHGKNIVKFLATYGTKLE
ncbi:MAG: DUF3795 domain-containing protein [Candidatus Thorarchaeota archaeon]